eukprot:jgi/Mesvir1/1846/Mv06947-RA.1
MFCLLAFGSTAPQVLNSSISLPAKTHFSDLALRAARMIDYLAIDLKHRRHNGDAAVSRFFHPRPTGELVEGIAIEEAAFRGRALSGSSILLPDTYEGLVLERESARAVPAGGSKSNGNGAAATVGDGGALSHDLHDREHWVAARRFGQFSYWNRETVPTQGDLLRRALHLLDVAARMQMPVSPATVLERVEKNRAR